MFQQVAPMNVNEKNSDSVVVVDLPVKENLAAVNPVSSESVNTSIDVKTSYPIDDKKKRGRKAKSKKSGNFDLKLIAEMTGLNLNSSKDYANLYKLVYDYLKFTFKLNDNACEDLTADVMLKSLYERLDSFDPSYGDDKRSKQSKFKGWVKRLAHNAAIDYLKEQKNTVSADKEYGLDNGDDSLSLKDLFVADVTDAEREREHRHKIADLMYRTMWEVPGKKGKSLRMREMGGMKYDDIAKTTNQNLSTVKTQIKKGREELGKMIKKELKMLELEYKDVFKETIDDIDYIGNALV